MALACAFPLQAANAASFEQIQEKCREAARPQVQACVQGNRANLPACRDRARPGVRACIQREAKRIAGNKSAPAPPRLEAISALAKGRALPGGLVPPPRSIGDITEILDKEKPEAAKLARREALANAHPPKNASARSLAQFYYDRGNASALLGRDKEALADALMAIQVGKSKIDAHQLNRLRQFASLQYGAVGNKRQALELALQTLHDSNQAGMRGQVISVSRRIAGIIVSMGDVERAEGYARRVLALVQEARGSPGPKWRTAYANVGTTWEADADLSRALIFKARGQLREAEAAYVRAEAFRRASVKNRFKYRPPTEQILLSADYIVLAMAKIKAVQRRLNEAEADARRALLGVLGNRGKYNSTTPLFILPLANILAEQGRYGEAESLIRSAIEIQSRIGMRDSRPQKANALSQLAQVLVLQREMGKASEIYARLDIATSGWDPERREAFLLTGSRISMLYRTGRIEAGIAASQELLSRVGEHSQTNRYPVAAARGLLAIGLALTRRDAEATEQFKVAIPVLLSAVRENVDDEDRDHIVAARRQHLQAIVEAYMSLLARATDRTAEAAAEAFALADGIRGRTVQRALSAASARTGARDAALAELARNEQDLAKQITAQLGMLNNALSLASSERDAGLVGSIKAQIDQLRGELEKARRDIQRRFPNYASLVDPKSSSVRDLRATLKADEALLSYYFGEDGSFVWSVSKDRGIRFAVIAMTPADLAEKVRRLRLALEPQVTTIFEIPAFDLGLASELYSTLLQPVEDVWRPAKSLIVVTNGALGLLPLSLLPTSAAAIDDGEERFGGYRKVPWLARTHAITMLPSATALTTLRTLPPGRENRDKLVAFGDPVFGNSPEGNVPRSTQIADASSTRSALPLQRRSIPQLQGVDSAELATLPALPDTAEELRSIAAALEADPAKALYLGREASEKNLKSLDLSAFKVLAFATHGLLPGELRGLTQPALALAAPDASDNDGDGLLTMEEILALRLDADWVVLSACNTASGAETGAEAASGLGRAFFYAGARALLVTNWPVHSFSARELVSDLFRRQAKDLTLTRSQALREAVLALIDGAGYKDPSSGETLFSYAHPLFWAPYSIIGDGAKN